MVRLPLLVVLPVLLGLPACAAHWDGDPAIYGLALEVALTQRDADWAVRDDLKPRLRTVVAAAAAFWGIPPEAVSGWRLRLTEGLLRCGGRSTANGCTTTEDRTVTITANVVACVESSTLVHELGHLALGDPDHRDPRWRDGDGLRAMWAELHAGVAGAPDCGGELYRGQWQGF